MFEGNSDEIIAIFFDDKLDFNDFTVKVYDFSKTIKDQIEKFLHSTITMGIGKVYRELSDVYKSYEEANYAFKFRHVLGKNTIISYNEVGLLNEKFSNQRQQWDKELINKIVLGFKNEAIVLIDNLQNQLNEKFASLQSVNFLCIEITILLFKEISQWKELYDKVSKGYSCYEFSNEILKTSTNEEIFYKLRMLAIYICECVSSTKKTSQQSIVEMAKNYIEENYSDSELSLNDVAGYAYVSPAYLSIIFKQVKNINFSSYLFETRMKKATSLLENTDLKYYEIAEMVGYRDANYFSSSFKKYSGVPPSEYKSLTKK